MTGPPPTGPGDVVGLSIDRSLLTAIAIPLMSSSLQSWPWMCCITMYPTPSYRKAYKTGGTRTIQPLSEFTIFAMKSWVRASPMASKVPYLIHADSVRSGEYSAKPEGPGPCWPHFVTTAYGVGSHAGKFKFSTASGILAILAKPRQHISDEKFSARAYSYFKKDTFSRRMMDVGKRATEVFCGHCGVSKTQCTQVSHLTLQCGGDR